MRHLTDTPAAGATAVSPGQLELFRPPGPRIVITYARPDGGALTDADFDHLARLARATTSLPEEGA